MKKPPVSRRLLHIFAGDNGFEPLLIAPEAIVLPLDESPRDWRAVFYHAVYAEARDLFSRDAAGVVFNIHEDKQDLADGLQANKIP